MGKTLLLTYNQINRPSLCYLSSWVILCYHTNGNEKWQYEIFEDCRSTALTINTVRNDSDWPCGRVWPRDPSAAFCPWRWAYTWGRCGQWWPGQGLNPSPTLPPPRGSQTAGLLECSSSGETDSWGKYGPSEQLQTTSFI